MVQTSFASTSVIKNKEEIKMSDITLLNKVHHSLHHSKHYFSLNHPFCLLQ